MIENLIDDINFVVTAVHHGIWQSTKAYFFLKKQFFLLIQVLSGKADISLDQTMWLAGLFGQHLPYTYSSEYIFFELKPDKVPQYVNIVKPFDLVTWAMLVISFISISAALKFVSHHNKQVNECMYQCTSNL